MEAFNSLKEKELFYDVDEIKAKNNIIQVARELGLKVTRSVIPCIKQHQHKDKNGYPSMSFNLVRNTFKCWVCPDVGGDVIDLVRIVKNISREKALEYLAIRAGLSVYDSFESIENNNNGNGKNGNGKEKSSEIVESYYREFFDGLDQSAGLEALAFVSLKGGTGKSMIVNNLAAVFSLITKYIADTEKKELHYVDLIDLDFGKPDQRILTGVEPEFYLEDVFYNRENNLGWKDLRTKTRLQNFSLISSSPVRKAQSLFYMHKNEIMFMLNDSDAHIKLTDFGGGISNDILDFLMNIRSKVCVVNDEETSKEAIFNLILTIIYDQLKKSFQTKSEIHPLLDKLRLCKKTGFTIEDFSHELEEIDKRNTDRENVEQFYQTYMQPLKELLGCNWIILGEKDHKDLKKEIDLLGNKVKDLLFKEYNNGGSKGINFSDKTEIYKKYTELKKEFVKFDSCKSKLENLLRANRFGLIVNKSDSEKAFEIYNEITRKIKYFLGMKLCYLGSIEERDSLRNISNHRMPYVFYNYEDDALRNLYAIADRFLGLKEYSTEKIIYSQKDFIRSMKNNWGSFN